jgi:signal transduction histidine kinase
MESAFSVDILEIWTMMKGRIPYLVLFCLCFLSALPITAQTESEKNPAPVWRYHPGDNLDWAASEFDDSSWELVDTRLRPAQFSKIDWRGIGWFRLHVNLPPSAVGKSLGIFIEQAGASEVYVDGQFFCRFGKAGAQKEGETDWQRGPVYVSLHDRPEHVIAVRYSNPDAEKFFRAGFTAEFGLSLADLGLMNKIRTGEIARDRMIQGMFSGLPFAFGLLHLLLFLFFRRAVENLYFAIAMFLTATSTFLDYQSSLAEHVARTLFYLRFQRLAGFLLLIFIARFIYSLFYEKLPRQFWVFFGALIVTGVLAVYSPVRHYDYLNIVSIIVLIEMFRVNIVAIYNKRDGAWIIFLGFVIQFVFAFYDILLDLNVLAPVYGIKNAYFIGTFGVIVCMSVYLARNFARTRKNLEIYSEELAESNVKLEEYSHTLEERVAERTRSLEERNEELQTTLRKLTETQAQLIQSGKMAALGSLVAGIAHEMNNPIGVIHSMADTANRGVRRIRDLLSRNQNMEESRRSGEQLQQSLEILETNHGVITTASDRVASIVQSLRSFATLDEALFQQVDLHKNIDTTLTLIQHELRDKVKVIKEYCDIPRIQCYPNELNQTFMNLLRNAVEAIEQQGTITIATYSDQTHVYIRISDTGRGIPSEDLPKIYDPGFTTQSGGVGKGLGLSIVYNIIQKHNGDIKIESEVGKGTEVIIALPIEHGTEFRKTL